MKNKNIIPFIAGQNISLFGSLMVQFAIIWHINLTYEDPIMTMYFTLAALLPQLVVTIFAGVFADRLNKKLLIGLADTLIASATLVVAILWLLNITNIILLFILVIIRSVGQGIQQPTVNAILPELTTPDNLGRINGISSMLQSLSMILAPIVSAALLSFLKIEFVFFVDVITAAIGLFLLVSFVKYQSVKKTETKPYFTELKLGMKYIKNSNYLFLAIILVLLINFLATPGAMISSLYTSARLIPDGTSEAKQYVYLVVLEVAFGLGAVIGGIVMSIKKGGKNRIISALIGVLIFAVTNTIIGVSGLLDYDLTAKYVIFIITMFIAGTALPALNIGMMTSIQENEDPNYLGRIFGIVMIVASAGMPLGMLVFSPLAELFDYPLVFVIAGALILLVSLLFSNKNLRKAGIRKEYPRDKEELNDTNNTVSSQDIV